jgi:hypothetical protein
MLQRGSIVAGNETIHGALISAIAGAHRG